jgi:hypothetical protein
MRKRKAGMKVKPLEQCAETWARNSMKAYLDGKKNLNWIAGITGSGPDARKMFEELRRDGKPERQRELSEWFGPQS